LYGVYINGMILTNNKYTNTSQQARRILLKIKKNIETIPRMFGNSIIILIQVNLINLICLNSNTPRAMEQLNLYVFHT